MPRTRRRARAAAARPVCAALLLAPVLLVLAPPAGAQDGDDRERQPPRPRDVAVVPGDPDDATLLARWEELDPAARREVVEYLELDLSHASRFQLELARWVVRTSGVEPGLIEPAREPRWFDPQVHAPAQPIARRLLAADARRVRRAREQMSAAWRERAFEPAFGYDWGARQVVRLDDPRDPSRRFRAALAGLPADACLVEAHVSAWLDDGAQQAALEAFGHLYTDRDGRVFPGITLYRAWSSGTGIEMPDVDTLGIVHSLDDEWDRWVAPVPQAQHAPLYARIGEHFVRARHHRGLREALASAYLVADPAYADGYTAGNTVGFHALWNRRSSDPHALAKDLPAARHWAEYLEGVNAELAEDEELWAGGLLRRDTLAADQAFVRHRLVAIMRDLDLIPPPPAEAPADPDHRSGDRRRSP